MNVVVNGPFSALLNFEWVIVERQPGWESSDNQDENLVSRRWNDGRCSLAWSSTLQNRKQGL
jgi:hypothetical protein